MRRCWIHIGMHKTGSTSVQVNLAEVRKPSGWRILTLGGGPNLGQPLHAMFSAEPHKFHWFAKRGDTPEGLAEKGRRLRDRLAAEIRDGRADNIIISAEALSLIDEEALVALRDFLHPFFDEIRVIGYVRPPAGFINSAFQQKVKHGRGAFEISGVKPRYQKRFRKFDKVFGRDNVILRKFEPAAFPDKCIVADFCAIVGIAPPDPASIRRVNESLTREACGILFAYRKFGPGYGVGENVIKENTRIIAPLFAMKGAKFKVSQSILQPVLASLDKDIRWMEKRLGAPLGEIMAEDGTEVAGEDDLLTIRRSSCEEFATRFFEIHGIPIPLDKIPSGDPVDPQRVAGFVEYCRGLCREQLVNERSRGIRRLVAAFLKYLRKTLATRSAPAKCGQS